MTSSFNVKCLLNCFVYEQIVSLDWTPLKRCKSLDGETINSATKPRDSVSAMIIHRDVTDFQINVVGHCNELDMSSYFNQELVRGPT